MLTKADFASSQEVRWCPGCGDYSILAAMQRVLPELNIPKENIVFISGIGCAGRFPYYMNTYGFHTIHGRAPAIASGLKIARPDLSVWVITGDGDALSIGGNHFIHLLRRNFDVKVLLFNNQIYGLTKGQYSPTSEQGKITNTTPYGSIDRPINPVALALSLEASFVARGLDVDAQGMHNLLTQAAMHKGTAFIEIYQNCHIFNDGAFSHVANKATREDNRLWLEEGKPMIFGANKNKAIVLDGFKLKVIDVNENSNLPLYDSATMAPLIAQLNYPEFPVPMGMFRRVEQPTYETLLNARRKNEVKSHESFAKILRSGHIWQVE